MPQIRPCSGVPVHAPATADGRTSGRARRSATLCGQGARNAGGRAAGSGLRTTLVSGGGARLRMRSRKGPSQSDGKAGFGRVERRGEAVMPRRQRRRLKPAAQRPRQANRSPALVALERATADSDPLKTTALAARARAMPSSLGKRRRSPARARSSRAASVRAGTAASRRPSSADPPPSPRSADGHSGRSSRLNGADCGAKSSGAGVAMGRGSSPPAWGRSGKP